MEQQKATVILVYGPPCSGKSTYIRENIKEGDVLLDIDEISEEIYNTRQRTTTQLDHVLQEREARLKNHLRDHVTIWIPTTYVGVGIFTRIKHKVIHMKRPYSQCIDFLDRSDRVNKEYQRSIIKEWFDRQG
jgi:predicted kinase